jgi:hypothetical protein
VHHRCLRVQQNNPPMLKAGWTLLPPSSSTWRPSRPEKQPDSTSGGVGLPQLPYRRHSAYWLLESSCSCCAEAATGCHAPLNHTEGQDMSPISGEARRHRSCAAMVSTAAGRRLLTPELLGLLLRMPPIALDVSTLAKPAAGIWSPVFCRVLQYLM